MSHEPKHPELLSPSVYPAGVGLEIADPVRLYATHCEHIAGIIADITEAAVVEGRLTRTALRETIDVAVTAYIDRTGAQMKPAEREGEEVGA